MEADVEAAGISLPLRCLRGLNLVKADKCKYLLNVKPVIKHIQAAFLLSNIQVMQGV
jgi:hypothetical protein